MEILLSFWNVLAMMAPWLLVGFLLAGVVSVLLPRKWVVGVHGGIFWPPPYWSRRLHMV